MHKYRNSIVVAVLAVVFIEVVSMLVVAISPFTVVGIRESRSQQAADSTKDEPAIQAGRALEDPVVLHPYFGFVYADYISESKHGFFGEDILAYGGLKNFNVVIIGGSVAGNFYSDMHVEVARQLRRFKDTNGKTINVFTFSVGGWHQPQQLLSVVYFLSLGAKIDLLINIDGFNEASIPIGQAGSYSIYYPRAWPALTDNFSDPDRRKALSALYDASELRTRIAKIFHIVPIRYSTTASLIWKLVDQILENRIGLSVKELEAVKHLQPYQAGYRQHMDENTIFENVSRLWVSSSKMLYDIQRSRGKKYIHVLQPNQYVENSKPLSAKEMEIAYRPSEPFAIWARKGYRYLRNNKQYLANYGVPFLDAVMVFKGTSEDLYRDACCHFNKLGNDILLREILRFIDTTRVIH